MTRAAFWYSGPRPAVYAATRADHSSGVRAPPSRLRSISGTTNISGPPPRGDVDARWPVAPHPGVRPARGARTLGGPGPRDRGAPHRARGHGDQGARSADRAAALSRGPGARLDELRGAVEGVALARRHREADRDRKSTRLNSSHGYISYAVFCLKKKIKKIKRQPLDHAGEDQHGHAASNLQCEEC